MISIAKGVDSKSRSTNLFKFHDRNLQFLLNDKSLFLPFLYFINFNCFVVGLNATYGGFKEIKSSTAFSFSTEQEDTEATKKHTGYCYRHYSRIYYVVLISN